MSRIPQKWRPPLWMVVGGTVSVVLWLPIIGILIMRQLGPTLGWSEALYLSVGGVAISALVLGWMLWRILVRPITELRNRARGLRENQDGALDPLAHYGTAELQGLGQSVLEMGRVLQSREAVVRGYADHVTHEMKSPLTVVRGAAELLASPTLPAAERERLIARIEAAADRMTALLDAQRNLARAQEPAALGTCRVSDVGVDIDVLRDGVVPLPHETCQLVLEHLSGNARAHGATQITVSVEDEIMVVQDDGPGISQGNRERIFEPFFTTRRDAGGTGMGLSIVRRILEAHGAAITLAPSDGGARFEIRF